MSNVSGIIKSIQDIMRKDVGVDGDAQRISQLVWMFFLKIFDDREAELELLEDDYQSPLPGDLRWRAWAQDPEGATGEELADFVNLQLFPTLKNNLNTQGPDGKRAQVVRDLFADAYNYMKSGTLMRQVINKICEIDFNTQQDRHMFGSIYEQILKDLQSAGNAGEFYTPRAVTQFIVNRVDPQLAETVLDPACGTGGFLSRTIDHKRQHYVKTADLFMTLIIHRLKDQGRAAVVLPDGFFFGEGMKTRLKEKLLTECNLHTIIRLPNGVFNPYTGIKTNLLFFTKGEPTKAIWYYEHPYPEGAKSYNKTKPMRFAEFKTEIDWWGREADGFATRKETAQAWKVTIDEIKARNYNLDIKNPHVGEKINHDPDELLKKYAKQQQEISGLRDQLKTILAEALNGG